MTEGEDFSPKELVNAERLVVDLLEIEELTKIRNSKTRMLRTSALKYTLLKLCYLQIDELHAG